MDTILRHIISLLCFATLATSYGQTADKNINLLDSISISEKNKKIILMENDTFIIVTNYQLFIDNCNKFIELHNIDWDKDLLKLFMGNNSKIIYADSIVKSDMNKSRLVYRTSDLLEHGNCLVYNKVKKRLEMTCTKTDYTRFDTFGKIFYTKDKYSILKVVDGVF